MENMYGNRGSFVREEIRRTRHRSELKLYTACILCGLIAADAYPCSLDPPAVTAGDI